MRLSLREFLASFPPRADMRLVSWQTAGEDQLSCVIESLPWWKPTSEWSGPDQRFTLRFTDVQRSNVILGYHTAEVRDLRIQEASPYLWPYGIWGSIFGNAPLPDPRRFLVEFTDLFHHELHAAGALLFPFEPVPFAAWADRVGSNASYQLMDGPLPLLEAVRPLLEAQGLDYTLLHGPERTTDHLQHVWVEESWVVCAEVTVEIERTAT